jgi:hypothetical protein
VEQVLFPVASGATVEGGAVGRFNGDEDLQAGHHGQRSGKGAVGVDGQGVTRSTSRTLGGQKKWEGDGDGK